MAQEGMDLRSILEQDRLAVLDLLEQSRKLVVDVRASHYWTLYSMENFTTLEHIGGNLRKMLGVLEPHWDEGKRIFNRPEGAALWKTSAGLLRAIGPIRAKFIDQLDRRRRQRIMGQEYDEVPDVSAEIIEQDRDEFVRRHAQLVVLFDGLHPLILEVPAGIIPAGVAGPSPNGQYAEVKDGVSASDIAPED
jgi:hypothetical protein